MTEPANDSPAPLPAVPTSTAETPAAPPPAKPASPLDRPPQPGARRPGGASRPFSQNKPRADRPVNPGGKPQLLDKKDFVGAKPNNRELDKLIEDELNQAMAGFDVTRTVEVEPKPANAAPQQGGRKKGTIVGIHGKDVFVEVPGGRSQGVLPIMQFEDVPPKIGDIVEFEVERYDSANGLLLLTREGSTQVVHDWSSVTYGMFVEVKVTGTNKNKTGLTIEVNGIRGFLPASQLDIYRVENIEQFVNQRLKVMVAEVNPAERNLIVSRRAVIERERQVKAEEFWKTIAEGQVKTGIVRSVKPFGVFVDLGGADGLIPVSEISWQRVDDPNSLLKVGDSVEVKVSRIDFDARKIGLSLRAMVRSPWDDFAEQTKTGARLIGKVTRIAEFGAFVELAPGVEGLIHVSELSTQRVRRVRDIVTEGQSVEVEILSVDPAARRIGLSLKKLAREKEEAEDAAEEAERLGDIAAADERLTNRAVNPNLRGGIGAAPVDFGKGGS
ncbi:MAG TPA: S1 RNA-binding domain-containing protein [Urbifossiella sp.]|nr:S1 RNA-binding domain-containing protein [Urbifossiella sp.]